MTPRAAAMAFSAEQVFGFLRREFPQAFRNGRVYHIDVLEPERTLVRLEGQEAFLRPGGSISGPTLMELADFAAYVLLLGHHGEAARLAVTTNLAMSFLRKPKAGDLAAEVRLLRHGRTLSVADVRIHALADGAFVAHGECTYFMGPEIARARPL